MFRMMPDPRHLPSSTHAFTFAPRSTILASHNGRPNASKKHFHSRLLNLFLTILIGYRLVLPLVRIFERHLIFFPDYPDRLDGDWHPRALPVQDVWLTASDGTRGGFPMTTPSSLSSPFTATPPTSPTGHPSTIFYTAHLQTSLPWNTGVMGAAKENRAKSASTVMPKRRTNT